MKNHFNVMAFRRGKLFGRSKREERISSHRAGTVPGIGIEIFYEADVALKADDAWIYVGVLPESF